MIIIKKDKYDLLLGYNPCEIFKFYNVNEMHGLNLIDCENYNNTNESAYFAGWCNIIPNSNRNYVFINLSRCNTDIETFGLVMHELMHLSFDLHTDEEELITWAEIESYEVFELIKKLITDRYNSTD
jgi:hypothetical protein